MRDAKKTNKLAGETSPYLLEHVHNPVDWFPWGAQALQKAADEDKPLFISIGYSACHWCHVMARECFEDAEVARELNRGFVSVKVDREERPDIDAVYMRACEVMTGNGGWPLSVFADAQGKPFYAGTYFPKDAFLKLLFAVREAWENERGRLSKSAARITALIDAEEKDDGGHDSAPIQEAAAQFRRRFDPEYGGFGSAPKFPAPHNLMFLLRTAPELAEKTLECMFRGGMFDHVGGGFCRYSTDRFWLVPHFEKMLYDNALLAIAYLTAYEQSGRPLWRAVAERTLAYMERELRAPDGGFYASQDADSEGMEGRYYLFSPGEIREALGDADGARFCLRYGITETGNFEGLSVPNLLRAREDDAETDALLPRVYDYRKKRVPPRTDVKKLTAWNALAAAAFAAGGRILKHGLYADAARDTLAFIGRELSDDGAVLVGKTSGKRLGAGFLSDYAFYAYALIEAYEATFEESFLSRAAGLAKRACALFEDAQGGGFFLSGKDNETLVARTKESYDGAMPSGNSVMAYVLSRLALLTDDEEFARRAERQSAFMNGLAASYPAGYGFYLYGALPVKKIVCATNDPAGLRGLRVRSDWAFRFASGPEYPIIDNKTTYYVCEGGVCHPPAHAI
ncbi:MAG TPA: thioredoxin domain-containing protein [Clostridia bacterium]|mgnify:FL=1|nr:thioredoxin domain-containing protein [Clostridia bacterium]